ncbi:MAG: hypothetical protein JWP12_338 [Bacteroidetes bacterium]|nr:hypothetical protein [Bacteroidota bacterium]
MKNSYTQKIKLTVAAVVVSISGACAQVDTSSFDDLTLSPNFYNDNTPFISGQANFNNDYPGYWAGGFAYSNMGDTTTSPSDYLTQLYQTKAGAAHRGQNFGIGTMYAGVRLGFDDSNYSTFGIYITNTTYAYNSMALGDAFGKKFGDTSTTVHSAAGINEGAPDWFKLSIIGYNDGVAGIDTINFYLADFRFSDNSQDYIVKNWQYINLLPLGGIDSIAFVMSSSDNGSFGMNTPAYFCVDDLAISEIVTGITNPAIPSDVNVYPNPFVNSVAVDFKNANKRIVNVYNAFGAVVLRSESNEQKVNLNLERFDAGIYFVNVIENGKSSTIRVIKK